MTFDLSDEQRAIFEMASGFANERIAPHALEWEAKGEMPKAALRAVAELGMAAIYVREELGHIG